MSPRNLVVQRVEQLPSTTICDGNLLSYRTDRALRTELVFENCREGLKTAASKRQYAIKHEHGRSERIPHISPQG
jgi:hypothetical protein